MICKNWKTEWGLATTVVCVNSSANPILNCWRLGELRAAVVQIVKHLLFYKVMKTVLKCANNNFRKVYVL